MNYVRLTLTVKSHGLLIPENEVDKYINDRNKPWFKSFYTYPESALDYYKTNKNSMEGYSGEAHTQYLVFDIDAKDLEVSRENMIRLIDSLKLKGLYSEMSSIISFSGSKGFHLFV